VLNNHAEITHTLRNGIKLKVRASTSDACVIAHIVVKNFYMLSKNEIKNAETVVDLGAHIGLFSLWTASRSKKAAIFSFEPEPSNYNLLEYNIETNKLQLRIKPYRLALSGKNGELELFKSSESVGHSLNFKRGDSIKIQSITLEDIFHDYNISKIDILKVDIEGAEYSLLKCLDESLFSRIGIICMECHDVNSENNIDSMQKFLKDKGFIVKRNKEQIKAINKLIVTKKVLKP